VLRLAAGDSSRVEVVGNGRVTRVKRDKFDHIVVEAGDGDDAVTIDDSNGVFTDTEMTTLDGEGGDDTLQGGAGAEHFVGGDNNDFVDGGRGTTPRTWARATTRSSGIRARAATSSRARPAKIGCCSMAPRRTRRSRSVPTARGSCSTATPPTSTWTSTASSGPTSTRSAAST